MIPRRTALLGFGHVAEHGHLPAWRQRQDFTVVAVADPDPNRRAAARRLLPDARVYDDPAEALAAAGLDAVSIATPPAWHAPLALRAAERGLHILCEKPLTTSPAEYRAVVCAATAADVTVYTVHNWKHSEQFRHMAALLAQGAVGRPTDIRLETIRSGRAASVGQAWRGDAALAGGGILVDHGWHALYLLLALAGEAPRQIRAITERRRFVDAAVEDTVTCEIEFASLRGEIFLTWAGERRHTSWQARGPRGTLRLVDDRGELRHGETVRELSFARSLSDGSHHPDWFGAVLDGFAAEIADPARRGRNLAEAERCVLLTALAYASAAEHGRTLEIPTAVPGEIDAAHGDAPAARRDDGAAAGAGTVMERRPPLSVLR